MCSPFGSRGRVPKYARTRLLRDAAAAGCTTADGELMLLHQGAAAFTLWTGQPAPLELMQTKLAEARAGGIRSAEGEPAGDAVAAPSAGESTNGSSGTGESSGESAEGEPTGAASPD